MNTEVKRDLSVLTTISEATIDKLNRKVM